MNDRPELLRFDPPFYSEDAIANEGLGGGPSIDASDLGDVAVAERVNRALRASLVAALQKLDQVP